MPTAARQQRNGAPLVSLPPAVPRSTNAAQPAVKRVDSTSATRKRRSRDEQDETQGKMANDDIPLPCSKKRRAKGTTSTLSIPLPPNTDQSIVSTEPIAPAAASTPTERSMQYTGPVPRGLPAAYAKLMEKKLTENKRLDHPSSKPGSIPTDRPRPRSELERELELLRGDALRLARGLEFAHAEASTHVQQTKQEMLLDMIKIREQGQNEVKKMKREKNHVLRNAERQTQEVARLQKLLEEKDLKYAAKLGELAGYKEDVDHLQGLNNTMQEDLAELRRIENEDKSARRLRARGLPPAYGSLDEEDNAPPYDTHKDGGEWHLASFKRTVRETFAQKLRWAHALDSKRRNDSSIAKDIKHATLFVSTSHALAEATMTVSEALNSTITPLCHTKYNKTTLCKLVIPARRPFIADRAAKLVLDLTWRVISTCTARPTPPLSIPSVEKSHLGVSWQAIDACLLHALHTAILSEETGIDVKERKAGELQHYFTQISALRSGLSGLRAGLNLGFFSATLEWLSEQVEMERMMAANRVLETNAVRRNEVLETNARDREQEVQRGRDAVGQDTVAQAPANAESRMMVDASQQEFWFEESEPRFLDDGERALWQQFQDTARREQASRREALAAEVTAPGAAIESEGSSEPEVDGDGTASGSDGD